MINPLHEYRRRKHNLPKKLRRHWLAGDYWKRNSEDEGKPRTDLAYVDENEDIITYSIGDKVELFEEEDYKAIYEITTIRGKGIADTLPFDDNKKYDFKFQKVVNK